MFSDRGLVLALWAFVGFLIFTSRGANANCCEFCPCQIPEDCSPCLRECIFFGGQLRCMYRSGDPPASLASNETLESSVESTSINETTTLESSTQNTTTTIPAEPISESTTTVPPSTTVQT
eukprot:Seg1666.13 transcript_id=Seg1666.13/GoldUCD/mRNA.D3Y31 product="hypothetical protein" protein_id=Seg1666.13/GoldUCD/D3Y31